MKLVFSYELTRAKWSRACISDGPSTACLDVWYLTPDAPGDLLRALSALLHGAGSARVVWEGDCSEYRWVLQRQADSVDIVILQFDVPFSTLEDQAGRVIFHTLQPLRKLAQKTRNEMQHLLTQWGHEGYARQWEQEFPDAQLRALDALLHAHKRGQTDAIS